METKAFSAIAIKSLNEDRREIEGMASTPTVDRDNDVINPFGLTFESETPLLLQHDHKQPVGVVRFGRPTAKGLPFKATIAKVDEPGVVKTRVDEAWHSVKSGIIKGVSIGFRAKEAEPLENGGRFFKKAAIHELSLTPIPANPEALITGYKHTDANKPAVTPTQTTTEKTPSMNTKQATAPARSAFQTQILKAVEHVNTKALEVVAKTAVAPASTTNTADLYYPAQLAGVYLPPTTAPLLQALVSLGAPQMPPNARMWTQSELLEASEVDEGSSYPGAAPSVDFMLSARRKFGLVVCFSNTMLAPAVLDGSLLTYVQEQLEYAANNATDRFIVDLMTSQGAAAASVAAAFAAFDGDLRTAVFIGHPKTLATLQDAANPNVGPRGGFYKTLPVLPSLAVPVGKLLLQDVKRIAVHDGDQKVERSEQATITVDTPDGPAVVNLFQQNLTALKITKYGDAKVMVASQVISL